MAGDITLDKEVFKALAGETRVSVLKALMERRKTQSELAKEMSLAAPTIKDHVDILAHAGLVREVDDGHKWKYIELTVKGKALLQPQDSRILVLLGTSLLGVAATGYLAYSRYFSQVTPPQSPGPFLAAESAMAATAESAPSLAMGASDAAAKSLSATAPAMTNASAQFVLQAAPILPTAELAILVMCLVVFGISVGMWIKKTY
jgi:DNA-binding transcriptional ArsR family regulator